MQSNPNNYLLLKMTPVHPEDLHWVRRTLYQKSNKNTKYSQEKLEGYRAQMKEADHRITIALDTPQCWEEKI